MRAPTKNSDGKTPSDIFMSACPHTRGAVYFWAWFNDKQARSTTTASTDKKYRLQNAVGYFYVGCSQTRGALLFAAVTPLDAAEYYILSIL